jgi:hypothetical protein
MAAALRSMSSSVVAQFLMLMRIARRPRHTVETATATGSAPPVTNPK